MPSKCNTMYNIYERDKSQKMGERERERDIPRRGVRCQEGGVVACCPRWIPAPQWRR